MLSQEQKTTVKCVCIVVIIATFYTPIGWLLALATLYFNFPENHWDKIEQWIS